MKKIITIIVILLTGIVAGIVLAQLSMQTNADMPENSKLCTTHILVKTIPDINRKEFSKRVLLEISYLDSRFDYNDRDILVTNMGDDKLRISIEGLWSLDNAGANLLASLENLESVESILEQNGPILATECQ